MDGGGTEGRIFKGDGLFAVVQSAGSSGGCGVGGEIAGGIADRCAGCRASMGGRGGAGDCREDRRYMRRVSAAADLAITPVARFAFAGDLGFPALKRTVSRTLLLD